MKSNLASIRFAKLPLLSVRKPKMPSSATVRVVNVGSSTVSASRQEYHASLESADVSAVRMTRGRRLS